MNNLAALAGALTLESIKGDIVTGTLDKLNGVGARSGKSELGSMKQTYQLSKDVLSSYMGEKGNILNTSLGGNSLGITSIFDR
ncbi:hypothetical protein LJC09_02980 [Desulfovibrio sp. OttesenSCG-928-F20]|nr:hypothetical protein [Desulfovibrio sp. OttesenSCG-928-M16]MDL2291047.1 hypothetical protein [Desulfovibrio sp. OttesenSCG-928-F20]